MASTYTSKYIIAGRRAGSIKQIINYKNCNNVVSIDSTPIEPFIITSGSPTIDYSNGYYTITFLDNGGITFLVPLTLTDNDFNALVVGGGGGGGKGSADLLNGGGGGAGGEVYYKNLLVYQGIDYGVIVGQGGSAHTQGSPSGFSNIIANGGNVGNDGTTFQGGNGGLGTNGGGSGGDGGNNDPVFPATNGVNGTLITINSTANYYGGGGGGGSYYLQPSSSTGGQGGGGGGGSIPDTGTPNTGGGGGGGNGNGEFQTYGGPGGSGIVILYFKYSTTNITTTTDTNCKTCYCPSDINSKIVKNSNPDVIPGSTQVERAVNAIKYGRGGKVVYGNAAYQGDGDTLLGRLRGQPLSKFLSMNRF
jgi:hypothetical protein